MAAHATPSKQPSSGNRTIHCHGWWDFCQQHNLGFPPSSIYAAEGSVAHAVAENALTHGRRSFEYVGLTGSYRDGENHVVIHNTPPVDNLGPGDYDFLITEEMASAVNVYLETVQQLFVTWVNPIWRIEERLDLSWLVPGMFGTGDFTAVIPLDRAVILDYKHGAGKLVDVGRVAGDNVPLSLYALGTIGPDNPHGVDKVEVYIVQPRCPHPDGPVRMISYPVVDLYAWAKNVAQPAYAAAEKPNGKLVAGDWCSWCPAENALDKNHLPLCPGRKVLLHQSAEAMFGSPANDAIPLLLDDVRTLPGERLDAIMTNKQIFLDWFQAVEQEAYARLDSGHPDPPTKMKLVEGPMPRRSYGVTDQEVYSLVKTLIPRKDAYVEKIKTPAALVRTLENEAKLTKADANKLIEPALKKQARGAPIMVAVDAPGKPLPPKVDRMFTPE
jgi:hypothetical protein